MNQDKRVLVVGAAGAAGMLCLLLLVLGVLPGVSTADDPSAEPPSAPTPGTECIGQPYFFANDAPAGSNRFGPELADHSLEAGMARFDLKLRSDAAFAAVWEDVILHDMANSTPALLEARATEFLGNEELWCEQVDAIYDAIDKMEVQDRTEAYETLLMVPRGDAVPAIRKTERPVPMEHVLVLRLKDGRTEFARYVCDLQPARPEIPGVPPVSVPVPPAPPLPPGVTIPPVAPPPPTHPPTTLPPGTTSTTRPTTTTRPSTTTTTQPDGKFDEDSPMSPDPNDPNEPVRPNTPEPDRPPETSPTTTQPRVDPPTTVAPPAPPPATTAPAPPPTTGCQDPMGVGLCE